jgi:ribonucleoside-triphosphate reductase
LLKSLGLTDEEMNRPLIGIANSFNEIIPGHIHLKDVVQAVKDGIRMAGGVPMEFNTIGICGMNEACINFIGEDITTVSGKDFASRTLDFMRDKMVELQDETGNLFNLEATPAESTSYRLARHDKNNYPGIITSGEAEPFYTNSSQLPVDYTSDIFEALDHQESLQCKYTGGTVFHTMLGERITDWKPCRDLVKSIAFNYKIPYFTLSPVYSICPIHGYLVGEHESCFKCEEEKREKLTSQIKELEQKLLEVIE